MTLVSEMKERSAVTTSTGAQDPSAAEDSTLEADPFQAGDTSLTDGSSDSGTGAPSMEARGRIGMPSPWWAETSCSTSRSRTFVRSNTHTRSSARRRASSCPCPTSTAITRAAPRWRRQSVKPPVDAPASRARAPFTSTRNCRSAAASLSPPLLTKDGPGPRTRTGSDRATRRAALSAGAPEMVTLPASMAT